jgi:hypothetical protein
MMPNYAYWSWNYTHAPSWQSMRRGMAELENELSWERKRNQVVWRGKPYMSGIRGELLKATANKGWSDVKAVNIAKQQDQGDVLTLEEFCG